MPEPEFATPLVVLDLTGIFFFAVAGALVAVRKNLDRHPNDILAAFMASGT